MTIFDEYVTRTLKNNKGLTNQRLTVEKELFHQDILNLISDSGLMRKLVFMGGTCLRLCYDAERLSEDLDFSTKEEISKDEAFLLSETIRKGLSEKYQLPVEVTKPIKETDMETWKIKIITHPGHNNIPTQQIHIDICHYNSYLNEIRLIKNIYSLENRTPLFVKAETMEEILIDKLIAFSLRNRIKNRDIWDIYYLYCRNIKLNSMVLKQKIADRGKSFDSFCTSFKNRIEEISHEFPIDLKSELSRFLKVGLFEKSILSSEEGPSAFHIILRDYYSALSL